MFSEYRTFLLLSLGTDPLDRLQPLEAYLLQGVVEGSLQASLGQGRDLLDVKVL